MRHQNKWETRSTVFRRAECQERQSTETRLGTTGVSLGHSIFLETYTLSVSMPSQFCVSVSQCAVDVPQAPHKPQKMIRRRSHVSWLLCTSRFPCTHRFTCCTFDLSVSIGGCRPGSCTSLPSYVSPSTPSKGLLHHFQRHLRGPRGLLPCCSFLQFPVPAVAQALSICRQFWPTWRNTAWLHNCHVRRLLALPLHFAQR